jgi:hypothetical protein
MNRPNTRPLEILLLAVVALAACGGPPAVADRPDAPVESPSPADPSPVSPADPVPSPPVPAPDPSAPVSDPDPDPVPPAAPKPPAPARPAVWSKARTLLHGSYCTEPVATVEANGRFHVAVTCDSRIRYATSANGRTWSATTFKRPALREEVAPRIAVDGSTLYVAFTRLKAVDGGCGDDGLMDVGVFYRKRQLPNGAWSAPIRIGQIGDRLQSFRVAGGVIHETYTSRDGEGPVSYGYLKGSTFRSVRLPGAVSTSLRVGDDDVARVAFSTGSKLRYATVRPDGRISARTVFDGRIMEISDPNLVLGDGNRAYVSWTAHQPWGGGCADGEWPMPKPGTYFATDAGGSWSVKRLSSRVGAPSLVLDTAQSVHVVFPEGRSVRHFTRGVDGSWTNDRIPGTARMDEVVVRADPASGALLLVGTQWTGIDAIDLTALTRS